MVGTSDSAIKNSPSITETEEMLDDFKTFDCSACHHHLCYQLRSDTNIRFCSFKCLATGKFAIDRLKSQGTPVSQSQLDEILAAPESSGSETPAVRRWTMKDVKLSDKFKMSAVVHISFVWDMSKLNLTAAEDEENMDALQQLIDDLVPNGPVMSRIPEVDDIVLAPYDDTYYRGRVTKVDPSTVSVVFVDLGDEATVHTSTLKQPTDEIMKHPIYGLTLQVNSVPCGISQFETPTITKALSEPSQLEISDSSKDGFECLGNIWYTNECCWSGLALDAIQSQQKQ